MVRRFVDRDGWTDGWMCGSVDVCIPSCARRIIPLTPWHSRLREFVCAFGGCMAGDAMWLLRCGAMPHRSDSLTPMDGRTDGHFLPPTHTTQQTSAPIRPSVGSRTHMQAKQPKSASHSFTHMDVDASQHTTQPLSYRHRMTHAHEDKNAPKEAGEGHGMPWVSCVSLIQESAS
mmetsp:Transcript_35933/g.89537  ORF Transcript_35933/g.89537 Transcript_35933/m.89537 type:complete len:174 (-) Transcript_35933:670-1191(-)